MKKFLNEFIKTGKLSKILKEFNSILYIINTLIRVRGIKNIKKYMGH